MSLDISVDIETLATDPRAVVVSVGAVVFDTDTGEEIESKYWVFDWQEQMTRWSRHVDPATLAWWLKQEDPVREVLTVSNGLTAHDEFADEFFGLATKHGTSNFWAKGPHFDIAILDNFFDGYASKDGVTCRPNAGKKIGSSRCVGDEDEVRPWRYNTIFDVRSLAQVAPSELDIKAFEARYFSGTENVAHNALADARCQAAYIYEVKKWIASRQ